MVARLLELPLKLTTNVSMLLSVIFAFLGSVMWVAARDAITLGAPILFWIMASLSVICAATGALSFCVWRLKWLGLKSAEIGRDKTLATNEGRLSDLDFERAKMRFQAEGRMLAATIKQIENGLIHPQMLGEGSKFQSFPATIINKIENGDGVPLLEPPAEASPLPNRVDLSRLLPAEISLDNLILGVGQNDEVITDSLRNLTHVGVAGSTRWGKSIFCQMLLYQILRAKEPTKVFLADLGGTSFLDFGLPYASSLEETELMITQVMSEAEHRKKLYQATGRGIKSLDMYNSVTGENLPHVVMAIDEALFLMSKSPMIKNALELCVSWSAKFGITCLIVSQDWKSTAISTATRNNFSSRFQFLAEDKNQSDILVKGSDAHNIETKGRCFSRLPGDRRVIEMQTPYISEDEIAAIAPYVLDQNGFNVDDVSDPEPDQPTEDEMRAIEAFVSVRDSGEFSWSKATKEAFGNGKFGTNYTNKLKRILDKFDVDYSDQKVSK